jgi:hypothetical protein
MESRNNNQDAGEKIVNAKKRVKLLSKKVLIANNIKFL